MDNYLISFSDSTLAENDYYHFLLERYVIHLFLPLQPYDPPLEIPFTNQHTDSLSIILIRSLYPCSFMTLNILASSLAFLPRGDYAVPRYYHVHVPQ